MQAESKEQGAIICSPISYTRLNPAKGFSVAAVHKIYRISWPEYGGDFTKTKSIVEGLKYLEITLSDYSYLPDYGVLTHGLLRMSHKMEKDYAPNKSSPKFPASCTIAGTAMILEVDQSDAMFLPKVALAEQECLKFPNIDKLYITFRDNLDIYFVLSEFGYHFARTRSDALDNILVKKTCYIAPCDRTLYPKWLDYFGWEAVDFEETTFAHNPGIYLRQDGVVKGGIILSEPQPHQDYQHTMQTEVEALYIDEDFRKLHMGKALMEYLLKYIYEKLETPYFVNATTTSYQAPWFYEKMGFTLMAHWPNVYQGHDDQMYDLLDYQAYVRMIDY